MYEHYSLILMLTHACNLRCSYCYMGHKGPRVLSPDLGRKCIDRAVASIADGGELELGFFGGEPLLEAEMLGQLIDYAQERTRARQINLRMGMTSNGTQMQDAAWAILLRPDFDVAISCDGIPEVHDRHRHSVDGRGSSQQVYATIARLVEAHKEFRVITVVRPDTLDTLVESIRFLRSLGVRHIEPSLDLWTTWSEEAQGRLEAAIAGLADLWCEGLPHHSIGWFDEKAAHLARLKIPPATRCGFGDGAVAVAPSGNLYPCERLIGEDQPDNPMRIPGNAADGEDFLHLHGVGGREHEACGSCAMEAMCNTFCRCSNYARSGDPRKPDRLLCTWNQACLEQTARILKLLRPKAQQMTGNQTPCRASDPLGQVGRRQ